MSVLTGVFLYYVFVTAPPSPYGSQLAATPTTVVGQPAPGAAQFGHGG